jgi:hypothetical protein
MRVYNHSAGQDPAGIAYRTKKAFDKCYWPEVKYRAMVISPTYLRYPADLIFQGQNSRDIGYGLYKTADVVHLNNTLDGLWAIGIDRRKVKKPTLLHHHGTAFREGHEQIAKEAREQGCVQAVSTIDLMLEPGLIWVPAPYDIAALQAIRRHAYEEHPVVRISHCPTQRQYKSTAAFVKAVERLRRKGRKVELDLVENTTWQECLVRKAKSDIHLDQMTYGYGCNAMEAWAMGIPVICGVDENLVPGTRDRMLDVFGGLPFYEANEKTIASRLDDLISDPELRDEWGRIGHEHAVRFHDEKPVADLLYGIYSSMV